MMRTDSGHPEIDEYLWPLTGEVSSMDWQPVVEELQIRQRLADIMAHVREMHVRPRLARLGPRASETMRCAVTESIIDGPEGGPPWTQTLREPVPRGLRDEWNQLAGRLCEIEQRRRPQALTE